MSPLYDQVRTTMSPLYNQVRTTMSPLYDQLFNKECLKPQGTPVYRNTVYFLWYGIQPLKKWHPLVVWDIHCQLFHACK